MLSKLDLDPKCQEIKLHKSKAYDLGNKKHPTQKNLSRWTQRNHLIGK